VATVEAGTAAVERAVERVGAETAVEVPAEARAEVARAEEEKVVERVEVAMAVEAMVEATEGARAGVGMAAAKEARRWPHPRSIAPHAARMPQRTGRSGRWIPRL
jgi:hypothetical protein